MRKLFPYAVTAIAFVLTSRLSAGPSTAAMASIEKPLAATSPVGANIVVPTFEKLAPVSALRPANVDELFADADEVSPSDPQPMIPLPPAVWAGFAGLAFVARRVLHRRRPAAA